ncbi:MAG TPA: protein phosphatase 2C domain-containing protein [Hyphomicrobiaceae bacterium]|nr:protein phosphatase 2C domain-containing protein [Hyphomicrobiaceae bacterium]
MLPFAESSAAIQGRRSYQEDSCAVAKVAETIGGSTVRLLAVLADGMGGHAGGARASRTICGTMIASFGAQAEGDDSVATRLLGCLAASNKAIGDIVEAEAGLAGMGATVVGVAVEDDRLHWISVGDSPLYLVRGGEIARLNEDHSLAPMLDKMAAEGRISREAAASDPRRHYLRSAVTGEELDLVDQPAKPLPLEAGDCILVMSDGIHTLEESEIAAIVAAEQPAGPERIVARLLASVEAAHDTHQDNTTVIAIVFGG